LQIHRRVIRSGWHRFGLDLCRIVVLKLICVGKSRQNRVVPGWSEIFDHATKYWIEQSAGMPHIEIERHQLAIQMQLSAP